MDQNSFKFEDDINLDSNVKYGFLPDSIEYCHMYDVERIQSIEVSSNHSCMNHLFSSSNFIKMPLKIAFMNKHFQIVEHFLGQGANINSKTPLENRISKNN